MHFNTIYSKPLLQTEGLEEAHRGNLSRIKWNVLRIWKERGSNQSIEHLYDALKSSGRADLAQILYEEASQHYFEVCSGCYELVHHDISIC